LITCDRRQLFHDEKSEPFSGTFPSNDEVREQEHDKAEKAVISAMQVEALWKISKIELDRTIQEACRMILNGEYFFFPTHVNVNDSHQMAHHRPDDGWVVGSTGQIIETNVGRLRAAAAMVLVGDILVRCSKEGTSWRE